MGRISCSLVMCAPLVLNFLLFNSFAWAANHGVGDNSVASVQPLASYSDVDAFLRGCMQNYGSKAVRRVKDQWAQTVVCLERIFFADAIEEQSDGLLIRILSGNGTTTSMNDAPITSLCNNHIPDIEQCIQSFIVALKGCTAVQGDHDLQSLGYALSGALSYACQHDGDRIVRFVAGGGTECLKEPHDTDILNCFQLRHSFLTRLQGNDSIFKNENCRIHQESNECIVRVFEQCTNPGSTVKDIVQGLLNTIMNETKCGSNIHSVNESGPSAICNNSFVSSGDDDMSIFDGHYCAQKKNRIFLPRSLRVEQLHLLSRFPQRSRAE
ncbi:hypothetical protein GHT06_021750 [Daphnia sinensis]|uniref:Secreted protein n=1 Tax=Daphnia sinensis TaxID=1820382 RepID=A0AAD5PLY2_9CRUS|nr:hypothetical protein GHT06_021750 [Daphnia sinensis]